MTTASKIFLGLWVYFSVGAYLAYDYRNWALTNCKNSIGHGEDVLMMVFYPALMVGGVTFSVTHPNLPSTCAR